MSPFRVFVFLALGAIVPLTGFAQGSVNKAIRLNGKKDRILFGDVYRRVNLPVTISAWVNLDSSNLTFAPVFGSRNCIQAYNGVLMGVDRDFISAQYGDGYGKKHPAFRRGVTAMIDLKPGKWVHVAAVVVNGDSVQLYCNGVRAFEEYTGTSNRPMKSDAGEGFASAGYLISNDVEYRLKGMLDELCFWNRALSPSEIRSVMCGQVNINDKNLIGYWDFNEPKGADVYDKSSSKLHGKIGGNPKRVATKLPCQKTLN
jgi:hypothetical protein